MKITSHATQRALERAGINAYSLVARSRGADVSDLPPGMPIRRGYEYRLSEWAHQDFILVLRDDVLITVIPASVRSTEQESS